MRRKNRLLGGAVVLFVVIIAACFGGGPRESSSEQLVIVADRNPVFIGSAMIGQTITTSPAIVLSPTTEGDDDIITSITENCANFNLLLGPNFSSGSNGGSGSARVFCDTGLMGSGFPAATNEFGGATYGSGACQPVTYSFNAQFTAAGAGSASCVVTVAYMPTFGGAGSNYSVVLDATGVAAMYSATITPSSINFNDIPVGQTSSPQRVRLTNNGTSTLTGSGAVNNGAFTVTPVGTTYPTFTIGAGSAAELDVRCAPSAMGLQNGTLTLTTQAGPKSVALTCNAITPTALTITPAPASFASTLVGVPPANLPITISNSGLPTTLSVSLTGHDPAQLSLVTNPNGMGLGSGSSTQAVLHYTAAMEKASGQIGTLVVNYSGGTARNIAINAEALPGEIGTTPGLVDFGPVCIGSTANEDVMIYASAAGDVNISSVTPPAAPFGATSVNGTLQGNHGSLLNVRASVTPTAPGPIEGAFMINTNLPGGAQREVKLQAIGLPGGLTPTPEVVHFGPGRVLTTTAAKEIELSNCASGTINITEAHIEGASAEDFAIVSPANPAMQLEQMGSVKFLVVMTPRANGTKAAQLVVSYDGGEVRANLDGNGFGGDDDTEVEMGTYYTCSAGGGAAGLPIALALLALRRRRRR